MHQRLKAFGWRESTAFVSKKSHLAPGAQGQHGLVGDGVSRIRDAGTDVLFTEAWITIERVSSACDFGEFSQQQFGGNAWAADSGLPAKIAGLISIAW